MSDPKHPKPGDRAIDALDLETVDVTADIIATFVKFHEGAEKAMANIERLKPIEMERAGINEKTVQQVIGLIQDYRRAEDLLPAAEKLAEMLHETKLERAHRIGQFIAEIVAQARRRAERDPKGAEILGPLDDLLDYQYGPARKAVATKEKKAAAASQTNGTPHNATTP
jgi:hypothetical protein